MQATGTEFGRWKRAVVALALVAVGLLAVDSALAAPAGFTGPEETYGGLVFPTNVEFAPDGRVFIIEKRGTIKTARTLGEPLTQMYDMTSRVHNYWDRGMLGLAVHPQFPSQPFIYVLYTHGVPLAVPGGPTAVWEDGVNETCDNPPGGTEHGCVVSAQLARLRLDATSMAVVEDALLIHDWCQQFPSHSIGDLEFGADGYLYVSAGEGAAFHTTDWGQLGGSSTDITPRNPCGDPPVAAGQTMPTDGSAEGGALRSQDLRTAGDPVSLSGTVIRINPVPGNLLPPDNPGEGHDDPNGKLVVAYGLRNPFRIAFRPGTNDLYIGDVGWSTWEEVNRHPNPAGSVLNFGWPCYEGGNGSLAMMPNYSGLDICEALYTSGSATPAFFAYRHDQTITHPENDDCPPAEPGPTTRTSSSTTGLAFYTFGNYPGEYDGALFGADYSRNCIWVMYAGSNGPDPSTLEVFHYGPPTTSGGHGVSPVDLEMGPDGNMYFISYLHGRLYRFCYISTGCPIAHIDANPTSGAAPLDVTFDGSDSSDSGGHLIVEYAWDFDDDGAFDVIGPEPEVTYTYDQPGAYTARLRVKNSSGKTATTTVTIQASNSPPQPVIDLPSEGTQWSVGETINFSGHATDPEEGTLDPSRLEWTMVLHHCAEDDSCHQHHIGTFSGVASGSFQAPHHEYPSFLELQLTARDQFGVETTVGRELQPRTVQLTFATDPTGLVLELLNPGNESLTAPFTITAIVGSIVEVEAPISQDSGAETWTFGSWSNGGTRRQSITAPVSNTTYTAEYAQVLGPGDGDAFGLVDVTTGIWYLRNPSNGQTTSFFYGNPGDYPFMGDWNCDGVETPGLYRQSDGFVYLRNSNTQGVANIRFFFGNPGDIPIAGDFNGNGCDTVSLYRPSEAKFYIINKLGSNNGGLGAAEFSYVFGNPGDKPFVGDFDGDGIDTAGLHRESTGLVYFRNSHTQGIADAHFIFGDPGDRMVAGRWAESGVPGPDTVGLFRPSNATVYLRFTNSQGVADHSYPYGSSVMWPVAGRFGELPGGSPPP